MKVCVTGASGFLGSQLCAALKSRGHEVLAITRHQQNFLPLSQIGCTPVLGNVAVAGSWIELIKTCDAVIHLAGEPIFKRRWTSTFKDQLKSSRVASTRLIAGALSEPGSKVKLLISGSAIGYYGADIPTPSVESSSAGSDFLAKLCVSWERAACISRQDVRVVYIRTGVVLSPHNGALRKMLPFFRLGLGGRLGSGKQMMSWIHIEDWLRAVLLLLENESLRGAFNLTAPYAVTNAGFTQALAAELRKPAFFPVPAAFMKMALGESSAAVLGNQQVRPSRLLEAGFSFSYPDIHSTLAHLLRQISKY